MCAIALVLHGQRVCMDVTDAPLFRALVAIHDDGVRRRSEGVLALAAVRALVQPRPAAKRAARVRGASVFFRSAPFPYPGPDGVRIAAYALYNVCSLRSRFPTRRRTGVGWSWPVLRHH
jgi:hypothetical protein